MGPAEIEEVIGCFLCGETRMRPLLELRARDGRWSYHVVACPGCGLPASSKTWCGTPGETPQIAACCAGCVKLSSRDERHLRRTIDDGNQGNTMRAVAFASEDGAASLLTERDLVAPR